MNENLGYLIEINHFLQLFYKCIAYEYIALPLCSVTSLINPPQKGIYIYIHQQRFIPSTEMTTGIFKLVIHNLFAFCTENQQVLNTPLLKHV